MEHPDITRTNLTGHHSPIEGPLYLDRFDNEIYAGDEIYMLEDDVYLIEELPHEALDILKNHGGTRKIA